MYGTPLRKDLDKVRRRLVFETEQPIQSSSIVSENNTIKQLTTSMAEAYVEATASKDVVLFLGYRHPDHVFPEKNICPNTYYCISCIDAEVGYEIEREDESKYLSVGEISLEQFDDKLQQHQSNYCGCCKTPLYKLADARCRRSRPTSNKWRKRFLKNKHYGLRGGGISRSTKQ